MEIFPEPDSDIYTAQHMFAQGKDCKIFSLASPQNTGEELHSHDYMQIWYVARGICHHWLEGCEHEMVRGEAFIVPPYVTHKTSLGSDSEIICCEFLLDNFLTAREDSGFSILRESLLDLSFFSCFMPRKSVRPKFVLSAEKQNQVEYIMRHMLTEYQENGMYAEQFLRIYILELLLVFARDYYASPFQKENSELFNKYRSAVERSITFIHEHYSEALTLKMICKYSAVSKTYFCFLFKTITRQTFVQYLLNIRVKHAIQLLETTDEPVTQICYEVGFNDLTHFSRTFKRIVGVSAREYRLQKRKESGAYQLRQSDSPDQRPR